MANAPKSGGGGSKIINIEKGGYQPTRAGVNDGYRPTTGSTPPSKPPSGGSAGTKKTAG